jgi:hypothetical protein
MKMYKLFNRTWLLTCVKMKGLIINWPMLLKWNTIHDINSVTALETLSSTYTFQLLFQKQSYYTSWGHSSSLTKPAVTNAGPIKGHIFRSEVMWESRRKVAQVSNGRCRWIQRVTGAIEMCWGWREEAAAEKSMKEVPCILLESRWEV